ncbi:MAG: rod shape-determining protein [Patescibacteria group bacterium]
MKFLSLHKKIGLDLGSDRIRICDDFGDILVDEPSCIAVDDKNQKVLAVGFEALEMRERVGSNIKVYHPIQSGIVLDSQILLALLKVFFSRVLSNYQLLRPTVAVSTPASIYKVDQEAIAQVLHELGAGEIITVASPLAASIGSGVPIAQSTGSCVLHMGKGLVEASIISLGSLLVTKQSQYAGSYVDERIQHQIGKIYSLKIGLESAEEIKKTFLSLKNNKDPISISGKTKIDDSPQELKIDNGEFLTSTHDLVDRYVNLIKSVLRETPPELSSDIIDRGILLTGGFSQLEGLREYLAQKLEIAILNVESPELVVVKGIATILDHLELFKESVGYQ